MLKPYRRSTGKSWGNRLMQRQQPVIVLLTAIIFLCLPAVTPAAQYREINTSQGKVIVGLDMEKALRMFGPPVSKGANLWHYSGPPEFFVSFSKIPSVLLYPDSSRAIVDTPLELKAFLSLPDSGIQDITGEMELVFDQPGIIQLASPGVIMPKRVGKFSILAQYKGISSNPVYMEVSEPAKGDQATEEKLLSIDILPYRPAVTPDGRIDFVALGTFFDGEINKYSVRDLSKEVAWFIRQQARGNWESQKESVIFFADKGQTEVLARYKTIGSFIQRVVVNDKISFGTKRLKHILVLPEVMVQQPKANITLRAFGTYYDNSVRELTQEVEWSISDPGIVRQDTGGNFFTKSIGVTEITANDDGLESLPVKVVVVGKSSHFLNAAAILSPEREDKLPDLNTLKEIKDNVEKLKKEFSVKKKELKGIKVTPKLLDIGLGEEGKLSAAGIYNDGSSSDLTILGSWGTLDKGVATASAGNVVSAAVGQTSAYVEFKGIRSEYATVIVGGPKLVSISLTPLNLRIPRDGKANLRVQGNYFDRSQRDLTELASWGIEGRVSVKIENGVVYPLKFGRSQAYAEYSKIKSNPASIDVVITLGWIFRLAVKVIFVLLLTVFLAGIILYLLAENKKNQLLLLKDKPREFILGLYENAVRLLAIFGLRYDIYTLPLPYAELAGQKFLAKDNTFLNFSKKFEEAKYSQHILQDNDVASALDDYNKFFMKVCKDQSRIRSFYRYCLALAHCRPIFIFPVPKKAAGAK